MYSFSIQQWFNCIIYTSCGQKIFGILYIFYSLYLSCIKQKNNQHTVDCFLSFIYLQNCIQEIFSFILPITLLGHALDRLVSVSSIHYCTSTSDLSTSSSSRDLLLANRISHLEGGFTLRCLQRLSRPDLATLPWIWYPTDTPAVRPSRSSRTKDSSSQISYAHAG